MIVAFYGEVVLTSQCLLRHSWFAVRGCFMSVSRFFARPALLPPTASDDDTYRVSSGAFVVDNSGNTYAINPWGQMTINGKIDQTTEHVDALGFVNGVVWQKNDDNHWYSKTSVGAAWRNYSSGNDVPPIRTLTPDALPTAYPYTQSYIQDSAGNQWEINRYSWAPGKVTVNGTVDWYSDRVIKLSYVNGEMWQENADGNWFGKVKPSDTWSAATAIDPTTSDTRSTLTWTGATTDPTQAGAWHAPGGNNQAPVAHETLIMNGTMNLGAGNLAGNVVHSDGGVINMTAGGSLKLDATGGWGTDRVNITGTGTADFNLSASYVGGGGGDDVVVTADATINLALHASMQDIHQLTVNAATIDLKGYNIFSGAHVLLNGDLSGDGTLDMTFIRSTVGGAGVLEINGAIGSGITVAGSRASTVILDNAAADQGRITLQSALLEIKNVATADHVSYVNSLVSLYQDDTLLAAIKVDWLADLFAPTYGVGSGLSFAKSASTGSVLIDGHAGSGHVHALDYSALAGA